MGEARRRARAGALAPLPRIVHSEPFGFEDEGQEPTHIVWPEGPGARDYVIVKSHWLSPRIDYVATLYEDGTARISRVDEKSAPPA